MRKPLALTEKYAVSERLAKLNSPTIQYPHEEFGMLIKALQHDGENVIFPSEKTIPLMHLNKKVCYIIRQGYVSFRQKENDRVVSYLYPQMLLGIGYFFSPQNVGYFRTETPVKLSRINEIQLQQVLAINPSLWNNLACVLTYMSQRLLVRDVKINSKNAYSVIRNLLMELDIQPDYVKRNVPVVRFIMERTTLARSTVMDILHQLRKGNYILMDRGYLFFINKLPDKF